MAIEKNEARPSNHGATTMTQSCSFFAFAAVSRQAANAALLGARSAAGTAPIMLAILAPLVTGLAGACLAECNTTVTVASIKSDSVTFKVDIGNCTNSNGTYDFNVHYKEPASGRTAEKVWSRAWDRSGDKIFEVTEYPSKAADEVIDSVSDVKVTNCVCRA